MFTGLIEGIGTIGSLHTTSTGMRLGIHAPAIAPSLKIGESIAVNGVCLTITSTGGDHFEVEAVGDTLEKTTLRSMKQGARVNLERALLATGRMDGHFVLGHVTGRARIRSWGPAISAADGSASGELEAWFLVIELEPSWARGVVSEGSIAIDGISLTVAALEGSPPGASLSSGRPVARISVIPHTRLATNLADRKAGDEVNVELDILASYVQAALAADKPEGGESSLDIKRLKSWGYR
jgi:riboflavin synthase